MVSCTNAFQWHSIMQPYFNSTNVLTLDSPLLVDTKYLCWIKPIMKCPHRPKSNTNGIFQVVYNYFSLPSMIFFFPVENNENSLTYLHLGLHRNDWSEKECNGGKLVIPHNLSKPRKHFVWWFIFVCMNEHTHFLKKASKHSSGQVEK